MTGLVSGLSFTLAEVIVLNHFEPSYSLQGLAEVSSLNGAVQYLENGSAVFRREVPKDAMLGALAAVERAYRLELSWHVGKTQRWITWHHLSLDVVVSVVWETTVV